MNRPRKDNRNSTGPSHGRPKPFRRPTRPVDRPARVHDSEEAKNYAVGRRAAVELLKDDVRRGQIEKVYVAHGTQGPQIAEILHYARKNRIALGELDKRKFKELEHRVSPDTDAQGVIVLVASRSYQELEDVAVTKNGVPPLLIALDGIEDPHNIGAIIRSAEAAGATAVLLPRRGAVLTPAVFKTSAGAAAHLPIVKYGNLDQTIRELKEVYNIACYGLAGEGSSFLYDVDMTVGVCLVTGSEEKGLHRLVRERCDALVKIPLAGKTESLNASVATGVAIFEAVRQRRQNVA